MGPRLAYRMRMRCTTGACWCSGCGLLIVCSCQTATVHDRARAWHALLRAEALVDDLRRRPDLGATLGVAAGGVDRVHVRLDGVDLAATGERERLGALRPVPAVRPAQVRFVTDSATPVAPVTFHEMITGTAGARNTAVPSGHLGCCVTLKYTMRGPVCDDADGGADGDAE